MARVKIRKVRVRSKTYTGYSWEKSETCRLGTKRTSDVIVWIRPSNSCTTGMRA